MRAVISGAEINLRDIALAKPGDVIHTDLPANVVLYAGDQPLLEGTFGVYQGRNAVRISKPVNRRILGEKYGRTEDHTDTRGATRTGRQAGRRFPAPRPFSRSAKAAAATATRTRAST